MQQSQTKVAPGQNHAELTRVWITLGPQEGGVFISNGVVGTLTRDWCKEYWKLKPKEDTDLWTVALVLAGGGHGCKGTLAGAGIYRRRMQEAPSSLPGESGLLSTLGACWCPH